MTSADLLAEAFDRIRGVVAAALDGLTDEQLAVRVGPAANSIAWIVWHLTRIQDDHVCDVAGMEQAWTAQGWYERFNLPFPVTDHGYGHTESQVEQVGGAVPVCGRIDDRAVAAIDSNRPEGLRQVSRYGPGTATQIEPAGRIGKLGIEP